MRNITGIILVILYVLVRFGLRSLKRVQQASGTPQRPLDGVSRKTVSKVFEVSNKRESVATEQLFNKLDDNPQPMLDTLESSKKDLGDPFQEIWSESIYSADQPLEGTVMSAARSSISVAGDEKESAKISPRGFFSIPERGGVVSAIVMREILDVPLSRRKRIGG